MNNDQNRLHWHSTSFGLAQIGLSPIVHRIAVISTRSRNIRKVSVQKGEVRETLLQAETPEGQKLSFIFIKT
jgi:hypothetical protein